MSDTDEKLADQNYELARIGDQLSRIATVLEKLHPILNDVCADEAITFRKVY